jgi:hypothetical protein
VEIVAAGVHHRHFDAAVIVRSDAASIRKTSLLRHWQSIEFGAQHHHRTLAILEHANYPGSANSGGDIVSKFAKLVGNFGSSLFFVIRKLGITMQVEIERFDLGIGGINLGGWNLPGLGAPRRYRAGRYEENNEEKHQTFHVFSRASFA